MLGLITTLSPEQARERARLIIAAAREGRDLNSEGRERAQKLDAERRALARRMTVSSAADTFLPEMGPRQLPDRPASDEEQCDRDASEIGTAHRASWRLRYRRSRSRQYRSNPRGNSGEEQAQCLGAIARLLTWAKRGGHLTTVVTADLARPPMRHRAHERQHLMKFGDCLRQLINSSRSGVGRPCSATLCSFFF